MIILNAHHETWLKTAYTTANKERFDSIWSQIATRFQNKSDSLLFEVINEPLPLSSANVDDLNARIITIMRRTNPTRIINFSGYEWSNSYDLIAATIPHDSLLIGYYHSYDPLLFAFCGIGTYGSDAEINGTIQKFDDVASWSTQHNVPVVLSEFGAQDTSDYNSRMLYYGTVTQQAVVHNVPFNAWEDGYEFIFYNRTQHTWTEVKDILIHTYKESPNNLKISLYNGTLIKIQWHNNTTEDDGIVIERKDTSGNFSSFATIASTDSIFIDTTTKAGTAYYYRLSVNVKDSIVAESYPIMLKVPKSATSVTCRSVIIGKQVWMVENLNVVRFRNGDPIPEAKTKEEWKKVGKESKPAWCYYNNDPKNANIFGKLYNWYAVNDKRKLAPAGWHIPTKAEFETLATPVKDYGRALKAKGQGSGNGPGTNRSGYSALLAGCRIGDGGFDGFGGCAYFWSSTDFNGTPRSLGLNKGNSGTFNYSSKACGYSVRCLKD